MTFLGFLTLSQPLDTVRTSARGWGQPRPSAPAGGSTCPAKARGGHLPAWSVTGPGHLLALLSWPERQTGEVSLREQAPENHLARGLGQQMQEEQAALMTAGPRWGPGPQGQPAQAPQASGAGGLVCRVALLSRGVEPGVQHPFLPPPCFSGGTQGDLGGRLAQARPCHPPVA